VITSPCLFGTRGQFFSGVPQPPYEAPREKLDQATVDEYAEAMEHKAQFPPVTVFYDGIDYWCVDGFGC
jgi:hypothetical protein